VPPNDNRQIAVAIHDIEPATFERCALIRDWLDDHGIGRVTLLVIPARDLHPLGERSPEMTRWLGERRRSGDAIAQHGFRHEHLGRRPLGPLGYIRGGRGAEFVGLDEEETRRAVDAGWRILKLAGIEPDGFVAPGYAYTPALRRALPRHFRWWAGLLGMHYPAGGAGQAPLRSLTPAWGTAAERPAQRLLAPALIRVGAILGGRTMRVDLHPAALEHPRQMLALEWVLARNAHKREAVSYEQIATSSLRGLTSGLDRSWAAQPPL
jgi:predicted deacetylase